ncbi:MAG: hypothetical protein K2K51_05705, partial [Bacteroidales bacterium]|nr:hypothetical protein [Bacteroidales bacterium]
MKGLHVSVQAFFLFINLNLFLNARSQKTKSGVPVPIQTVEPVPVRGVFFDENLRQHRGFVSRLYHLEFESATGLVPRNDRHGVFGFGRRYGFGRYGT